MTTELLLALNKFLLSKAAAIILSKMIQHMRAAKLSAPGLIEQKPLALEDLPTPEPAAGQVRIKISYCGVCHTDLHVVEGDIHPPKLPITPGHQVVGVIDAIGLISAEWGFALGSASAFPDSIGRMEPARFVKQAARTSVKLPSSPAFMWTAAMPIT